MTTTTSESVSQSAPIATSIPAMRERVRVGDLVSFEYTRAKHVRRAIFRVDGVRERTVIGERVTKAGDTIYRSGIPLRASAPLWLLVDVQPGPQTWADAIAEHETR